MICGSVRSGRICTRPAHHWSPKSGLDYHRAADGKHWYYDDAFLLRRWVERFDYCYVGGHIL